MKIFICSDSHGCYDYFHKALQIEKPDAVICAGDHSKDAIEMSYVFDKIPFYIVRGNTDYADYITEDIKIFSLNQKKIMLTHGHSFHVKLNYNMIKKTAEKNQVDLCIFGHTHRIYNETYNSITFLNPGALQDKKYIIWENNIFINKML